MVLDRRQQRHALDHDFFDRVGQRDGKRRLEINSAAHAVSKITQKNRKGAKIIGAHLRWPVARIARHPAIQAALISGVKPGNVILPSLSMTAPMATHGGESMPALSSGHSAST